ncbi:hypothetical protein WA026_016707 [Henosepilachna vigintioctopunctata]|uniref:C2H2-type domain-containing protein n=1 Tax=Henosepilachna vigintioctopunctata TaxID=420089 RepID=A0AAW1V2B6_9CUCU
MKLAHTKTCSGSKVKIEDEEIKCKICDVLFVNDQMKLEHVLKEHNVNLNAENICQYCYKNSSSLEEHQDHLVEIHSDEIFKREKRSYSCEVCLKLFRYVKDVIEHCVKEHEMDSKLVKPFLCDKCDTRFTSSANMIQHKQYHEGTRSHICSFCGKSYITKSDLTVHEYTHLNKRNYKCEICDRAFNTNKNLRSHKLVVHTDSSLWKYHCNMCDKRFPLKSGFDQHTRRHTGDKRFQCLICPKSFISSSELRKHMTFHSNVKAFKCSHCDKEYKDRRVYEIHLTKVHGIGNAKIPIRIKKFACHICPSTFFDKQKLSRHLCTHTGIKPYACTMCEKRFTDKSYLKHHFKVTHNVVELHFDDVGDVKIMH